MIEGQPRLDIANHFLRDIMGLLDQIAGQVMSGKPGEQSGNAASQSETMNNVLALIDRSGGFNGLLQKLKESGLQQQVASWIGTGENQAVSAEQIKNAVGRDTVEELAQQTGVPAENTASGLAQLLPRIIDQLTPNGQVPHDELVQQGLSLLKAKFFS